MVIRIITPSATGLSVKTRASHFHREKRELTATRIQSSWRPAKMTQQHEDTALRDSRNTLCVRTRNSAGTTSPSLRATNTFQPLTFPHFIIIIIIIGGGSRIYIYRIL